MAADSPTLRQIALAALALACGSQTKNGLSLEEEFLDDICQRVCAGKKTLAEILNSVLLQPTVPDSLLASFGNDLKLTPVELIVLTLLIAVEDDPFIGRVFARIQAPIGGPRPSIGLLDRAFAKTINNGNSIVPLLLNGYAVNSGAVIITDENKPLPERSLKIPQPLYLALTGTASVWPGISVGLEEIEVIPLPKSVLINLRKHIIALQSVNNQILVIRSGLLQEGRQVAAEIARELGCQPAFVDTQDITGVGAWLTLQKLLPVFCLELSPGERKYIQKFEGYKGPLLVVCGPDGAVETRSGSIVTWSLSVPVFQEREELWENLLGKSKMTTSLARDHRHSAGRIAQLCRLAKYQAALNGREQPDHEDIMAAAWSGTGTGLESLAEAIRSVIPDDALVVAPDLQVQLMALLARCRLRDELVTRLGLSVKTRYRAGVKALFTGESGTGKTLAAGWLATKLGSPLYRVDLSSITSKYIGETEKNLATLLARAEQAGVVLMFDEADSLFGKRTDVNNSNDRFANAQTNYLLQRIENYDGIVLLTSNNQSRLDAAFARRLDFVIEFPMPGPEQRRALWLSHLGENTKLTSQEINILAAQVVLCGGNIRNAVLAAAVQACSDGERDLVMADIVHGLGVEMRKLGRLLPVELQQYSAHQKNSRNTP
jgi:hypothetical protein